ncbi:sulfate adenylyltransferase, partial [Vibrio sp. 10N.222.55.E8]
MKPSFSLLLLVLTSFTSAALNKSDQRWIDAVSATYGERAGKRVATWRLNMTHYDKLNEAEKLESVNRFF